MNWVTYSLIAMLLFAGMHLTFKKLGLLGVSSAMILFFVFLSGAIVYPTYMYFSGEKISFNNEIIFWLFIAALLSITANLISLKAFLAAPNPGYPGAISSFGIIIVTVVSYFIFSSELNIIRLIGVILGFVGIILIYL
ncbi:MAG: EamA family transporter [Nanoarchaeota archaeon]|nr:EamA family transporter [Nanoarchaeota archaeon]